MRTAAGCGACRPAGVLLVSLEVDVNLAVGAEDARHAGDQLLSVLHQRIDGCLPCLWSLALAAL